MTKGHNRFFVGWIAGHTSKNYKALRLTSKLLCNFI